MIIAFISIIVTIVLYFFIGSFCLWSCGVKPAKDCFFDLFLRLIAGYVISTVTYSVVVTGFDTISVGFILVGLIGLTYAKYKKLLIRYPIGDLFIIKKPQIISYGITLVLLFAFFVFRAFFFYNCPFNNDVNFDYFCYSALGDGLVERGIETINVVMDLLNQEKLNPTPYHYFEIWSTMLISQIFSITSAEVIFVEMFSILGVMYVLGLIALVRHFSNKVIYQILAVLSVILIPFGDFDYTVGFRFYEAFVNYVFVGAIVNTKMIVEALFFVLAVNLYFKDKNLFFISIVTLALINITLTPTLFIALGCVLLYKLIFLHEDKKAQLIVLMNLCLISVFIILFYFCRTKGSYSYEDFSLSVIIENLKTEAFSMFKSTIKLVYFLLIFHSPAVIGLFLIYKRKDVIVNEKICYLYDLVVYIVITLISGFIISQLFLGVQDNTQFYRLPLMLLPILYLVIFVFLIEYSKRFYVKFLWIGLFCIILGVSCKCLHPQLKECSFFDMSNKEEVRYVSSIKQEFLKHSNRVGCSFRDDKDQLVPYRTRCGYPYQAFSQIPELNLKTISLSTLDSIPPEYQTEEIINRRRNTTFSKFAEKYQEEFGTTSIDSLQLAFVQYYRIEFMIVCDGQVLPKIFEPYIDTIICRPKNDEKFVFFKYAQE